jgi:hypothetical protein
MPPGHNT